MKRTYLVATVGVLAMTSGTCADWTLSLAHVSDNPVTGFGPTSGFGPSTTWHVWAHFSEPTDVLGVVSQVGQPMFVHVLTGNVFNQVTPLFLHQDFPPILGQKLMQPTGWSLDTFVTIGAETTLNPMSPANLAFTPGFKDLINNLTGSWNTADLPGQEGGWIALDKPDFAHGTDLLLMQLTVSQGALFEIVLGLDTLQLGYLHDWDGISFATHGTPGSGASYLTNIPAPGTAVVALLALVAPLAGRRRRV